MDRSLSRRRLVKSAALGATAFSFAGQRTFARQADPAASTFDYAAAAEPYKGTSINAFFLDRPGYQAAIAMIPEFSETTGIEVTHEITPYENAREKLVQDFFGETKQFDITLIDVVWIGEYADSGWITPFETFINDPALADPGLNLEGFFPILLESFGTWNGQIYGYPFDNYSGLLYYNKAMLEEAGFTAPPASWTELHETYGAKLAKQTYSLQSRRGETQSADSFMRMVWAFGGSLLKEDFQPNLSSPESLAGLNFRQAINAIQPDGVVERDHEETVQLLAQGQVATITEWSAFYPTLTNPESSTIVDSLGIAVEPAGVNGPAPALGGFSLGINSQIDEAKQKAAYLFIQWVTGESTARSYVENGGVSGRQSVYQDAELAAKYGYFAPLAESWSKYGNAVFRPRFAEWPQISEIIAQVGSEMQLGSVPVEDGVAQIEEQMKEILKPYYDGDKPLAQ